jgi:hypothetical protein
MWRSMLLLVLSCLFSLTSLAQKVEVFGGYQFTHLQPAFNASGWNVAVTGNFKHILGITGDFSGAYKDRVNAYTYVMDRTSDRTPALPCCWAEVST